MRDRGLGQERKISIEREVRKVKFESCLSFKIENATRWIEDYIKDLSSTKS